MAAEQPEFAQPDFSPSRSRGSVVHFSDEVRGDVGAEGDANSQELARHSPPGPRHAGRPMLIRESEWAFSHEEDGLHEPPTDFGDIDGADGDEVETSMSEKQTAGAFLQTAKSTSTLVTVFGPQEEEMAGKWADDMRNITGFARPRWIDAVFAITGVADLQYKIQQERERRAGEHYINPFPELNALVTSMNFEIAVGAVILLNCVMIGWEASLPEGESAGVFDFFEHVFTCVFVLECLLRILAFGWTWVFEPFNFADASLVFFTQVLVKWVMEPRGAEGGVLKKLGVLRTVRLVRMARAVRLQPAFKEAWILIHGLTTSARPLMWTAVIATSTLYIFSVAGTELIARHPDFEDHELAQELFGNMAKSMFTLIQTITLDSWSDTVARPLMEVHGYLAFFFVLFVSVGVFVLMNLVTAIIVENALAIVKEDQESSLKQVEQDKKRELKQLTDLFLEIDADGTGDVSHTEFFEGIKIKKVQRRLDLLEIKQSELTEVWNTLDDGDGILTIKEFTDGMRRMKGRASAKDIIDVCKRLRLTDHKRTALQSKVVKLGSTLEALERDTCQIANDMSEALTLFHEMYHRLDAYTERGYKEDKKRLAAKRKEEKREALEAAAAEGGDSDDGEPPPEDS